MSDDRTLGGNSPEHQTPSEANPAPAIIRDPAIDPSNLPELTLDLIMSSARLVERTAPICLRGDLEAEYEQLRDELATLVTDNGEITSSGDRALSDGSRVEEIQARQAELRTAMRAETYAVRFRALDSDAFDEFEKANRDSAGKMKDQTVYYTRLIARCAVVPSMTEAQVAGIRKKLNTNQFLTLGVTAWSANASGGVDVPK